MASIRTSLNLIDNMSRVLDRVTGKTDRMKRSIDSAKRVMNKETKIVYTLDSAGRAQARLADATSRATHRLEQQNNIMNKSSNNADIFSKKLNKLMLTLGTVFSVKKIIQLSDQITNTTARLNLMNDGLQTTAELQDKIFQSALRARGQYQATAEAVSKMGILAADAFTSNDEVIAFVEQLNKHFKIAGTSTEGQAAAMLQLTQAMGQGVLRGEELNSVFEQAPTIIQSIAKYLDVPIGQIRSLAQEGLITADVVKQALFATAEETNAKFAQMPMTFSDVSAVIGNTLLQTFEPALQIIGRGAQFIYDNWSILEPIFFGLASALTVFTGAMIAHKIATWYAEAANRAFIKSLISNPLFYIAIVLGVIIGLIYRWVKAVGGIQIAWQIAVDKILTALDWLKIGFFTGVYWVMDMLDKMKLGFMTANVAIQNYMDDMNVKVLNILQNMVNGAIGIINKFIGALNKIPGVSIDAISEVTFATTAKAEIEARKAQRTAELAKYRADIEASIAERDAALRQMKAEARAATAQRQAEIRAAQEAAKEKGLDLNLGDMAENIGDMAKDIGKIADNTGAIKDSIDISQEDLKWMRDLAEQETINRFTTATLAPQISINFTGDIRETADIDGIIGRLEEILTEEINIAAEGVHS